MDDVTSMSLVGSLMALTHSILINLFIKLELNYFTIARPARLKNCYKKARNLDRGGMVRVLT